MLRLFQRYHNAADCFSSCFSIRSGLNKWAPPWCCGGRCFSSRTIFTPGQQNHYEVLNIKRTATSPEIREAFLKLSKEFHPDVNSNDPQNHQKFVLLNEAYSVLSKPSSRRDYDLTLQFERHLRQQQGHSVYRSYGYQADSPHYHYRNNAQWDGMSPPSADESNSFHKKKIMFRILVNYCSLTAFFTVCVVAFLMMSKDFLVPDVSKKVVLKKDVDMHDFIMTSQHEGETIFYYAVPDNQNPEAFKVLAVKQDEDSSL